MGILLYHDTATDGTVSLAEGKVAGSPTLKRTYRQDGHFLHVDGEDHVVQHDVAEIQRIPGYRLASASEQEHFHKSKQKATRLTERKG